MGVADGPNATDSGGDRRQHVSTGVTVFLTSVGLFLFYVCCVVGGMFLGVVLTAPLVYIDRNSATVSFEGKQSIVKDGPNSVRVTLRGTVSFSLSNPTFWPLTFSIDNLNFNYYPTGVDPSCLLFHSRTLYKQDMSQMLDVPRYRKRLVGPLPPDATPPAVLVLSSPASDGPAAMDTPSSILGVNLDVQQSIKDLSTLKLLSFDCQQYNMILVSLSIGENTSESVVGISSVDGFYELVVPWNCNIDTAAAAAISQSDGDPMDIFVDGDEPLFPSPT
eukprot:GHVQ01004041.1.p1 GENE.GHVQ01004041.1~~GHVQ01004041.1.p1  ORF type:complete len:276 (+),score=27.63 GHVQ01004041.1:460-1287(+)